MIPKKYNFLIKNVSKLDQKVLNSIKKSQIRQKNVKFEQKKPFFWPNSKTPEKVKKTRTYEKKSFFCPGGPDPPLSKAD